MSLSAFSRFRQRRRLLLIAVVLVGVLATTVLLPRMSPTQNDGVSPTTTDPASEHRPVPSESASVPGALTLSGAGSQAVPFAVPLDHAQTARLVHEGEGRFVVVAIIAGRPSQELAAVGGRFDGTAEVAAGPDSPVEGLSVEASGNWTITLG